MFLFLLNCTKSLLILIDTLVEIELVPLSRLNLVKSCTSHLPLLEKVISIAKEKRKSMLHPAAISFATVVLCQFMDICPENKLEQHGVSIILPTIIIALRRTDNKGLQRFGYIAASLLAERVRLTTKAAQLVILVALKYADNGETVVCLK